MKGALILIALFLAVLFTDAAIHAPTHDRMKRQIYETFGGYPRQTVTTYGNHHSSVSSTSGGSVIGSGLGGGLVGSGLVGSGLGGGIVGTPIQHVSTIGEPVVTTYGGGGIIGEPYGGSVISPYGGNVVKKTVVTETFVNQGYHG